MNEKKRGANRKKAECAILEVLFLFRKVNVTKARLTGHEMFQFDINLN